MTKVYVGAWWSSADVEAENEDPSIDPFDGPRFNGVFASAEIAMARMTSLAKYEFNGFYGLDGPVQWAESTLDLDDAGRARIDIIGTTAEGDELFVVIVETNLDNGLG